MTDFFLFKPEIAFDFGYFSINEHRGQVRGRFGRNTRPRGKNSPHIGLREK